MSLALQSLVMMALLISGAVAALPVLLSRPAAQPSPPLRGEAGGRGLWIVETPKAQWFVNGVLSSRTDLQRLLTRQRGAQRIHYLPSDALPLERVALSLRWLRSLAPGSVVLELPPFPQLPR